MTVTGDGVWMWPDRDNSATEWRVDLAAGMFPRFLRPSALSVSHPLYPFPLFLSLCLSGGIVQSHRERAGVHSVCGRQFTYSWAEQVSHRWWLGQGKLSYVTVETMHYFFFFFFFFSCRYQWQRDERTVALFVVQNPERKRPWASPADFHTYIK